MIDILISVPMQPKPKNQLKATLNKKTGRIMQFRSKEDESWAKAFAEIAAAKLPEQILDEPLRLDILAVLPRPQRLDKSPPDLEWHTTRPDEDNIRKAVKDALKSFWVDDSLVCCGETVKVHAEKYSRPRTVVRIRSITNIRATAHAIALGLLEPDERQKDRSPEQLRLGGAL